MNKALTDDRGIRLKRLRFRSWHRGCKETDIILGSFADNKMASLSDDELSLYEDFLEEDDALIWEWLCERSSPERKEYNALLGQMKLFT